MELVLHRYSINCAIKRNNKHSSGEERKSFQYTSTLYTFMQSTTWCALCALCTCTLYKWVSMCSGVRACAMGIVAVIEKLNQFNSRMLMTVFSFDIHLTYHSLHRESRKNNNITIQVVTHSSISYNIMYIKYKRINGR